MSQYVETPNGIFTASGVWFSTTEAALKQFAAPVLEVVSIQELLRRAEIWLESSRTLAIWTLAVFLLLLPPAGAALGAFLVYVGWEVIGPSLVSNMLTPVLRLLSLPALQAVLYVTVLSWLAMGGAYGPAAVGVAGFILLRWNVLPRLLLPMVRALRRTMYHLPAPDQVLRLVIIRAALKHKISLPQLDRMEAIILENMPKK